MSELFVPISDHESSQVAGGLAVKIREIGPIQAQSSPPTGQFGARAIPSQETPIDIANTSNRFDITYGYVYGGTFNEAQIDTVKPNTTNTIKARDAAAAALGWDGDLGQPGTQLEIALLKPGYEYAFEVV